MEHTAASLLRDRGIQVTAQRIAVYEAVCATPHVTADHIAETVRQGLGSISRQAVYDALALLESQGLVRRIQPIGSPALFEGRVGDNHHHVICRDCGMVMDIDCAVGEAPCLTPQMALGFDIDEADVSYWGRCPQCQSLQTSA